MELYFKAIVGVPEAGSALILSPIKVVEGGVLARVRRSQRMESQSADTLHHAFFFGGFLQVHETVNHVK